MSELEEDANEMAEDSKLPIKIDLAAKASIELKAEVPKESMGRLLDALTDAIRPWTEARGLRADQIRLQRADIALEILKKAEVMASLQGVAAKPISSKLLVPFLEKASLEDKDEELRDAWATLLVSACRSDHALHITFVDILSRLSSQELKLIEGLCFANPRFPERSYPGGHSKQNKDQVMNNATMLKLLESEQEKSTCAKEKFTEAAKLEYAELMYVTVKSDGTVYYYTDLGVAGSDMFMSVEILRREQLVDVKRLYPLGGDVEVEYCEVTFLGIDFVRHCSPRAQEMEFRPNIIKARSDD